MWWALFIALTGLPFLMDKARWRWVKCFVCFLRFHSFWLGDPPVHSEQNWFLNLQVKYLSAKMEIFGLGSANKKSQNFLSHIMYWLIDFNILQIAKLEMMIGTSIFCAFKKYFFEKIFFTVRWCVLESDDGHLRPLLSHDARPGMPKNGMFGMPLDQNHSAHHKANWLAVS